MEKQRKKLVTLLKIIFSFLLIYFVFTRIQFRDVWEVLKRAHIGPLVIALILFILSKCFAALRINLYFHQLSIRLTQWSNARLYLLGMFYNLFLPGGIGGDAYKGYVIKKKYEVSTKRVIAVLLLDRLSGMLLLVCYACVLGMIIEVEQLSPFKWLFGICIAVALIVFWGLNKRYFNYVFPVFWKSLGYSALVQLCQMLCVLFILFSFDLKDNNLEYIFIFLISSVVAVLPLTIGGIGSREVVFFYGALWFGLEQNSSVSISVLFFFITALVSLAGIYFHFRKPELQLTDNSTERAG
ncbi:MAG: lysylphosphatidylglycerol synthase transmembrane domain-containing protein [Flavobacteriaceae bacterium]